MSLYFIILLNIYKDAVFHSLSVCIAYCILWITNNAQNTVLLIPWNCHLSHHQLPVESGHYIWIWYDFDKSSIVSSLVPVNIRLVLVPNHPKNCLGINS